MKKHAYTAKHKVLAGVAAVGLATALAVPFVAYGADAPALGWGIAGSRACGASCASADGDGVCDSFTDANGDGVCDNRGVHAACSAFSRGFAAFGECGRALGANFVDENGDGVCDHAGAGNANCPGYVDEDGNGACDNAGSCAGHGQGAGQSTGYGRGHGSGNGGGHHGMCAR